MAVDTFTTVTDEWDQPVVDDFRRDQWKRPLIAQGDGSHTGYTRFSTASRTIADRFNIEEAAYRKVAFGVATDSSLVARIYAIGGDPWSWTFDEKKAMTAVVRDAETAAKAHKAADIGTAVHHMTHRLDRGEVFNAGPYQGDLDAYRKAMDAHRLRTYPEYTECRMVNDLLRMAGTPDRIVWDEVVGLWRIADIKTGDDMQYGGLEWSAQLAAAAGGVLYDVTLEKRIDTPPIDLTMGYIIHLPAGQGECTIYDIDLVAGHRAAELANEIRAVRKASKGWITPKSTWTTGTVPERTKGDRDQEGPVPDTGAIPVPPRVRIPPVPQIAAPAPAGGEQRAGETAVSPATPAAPTVHPSARQQPAPTPSSPDGVGATIDGGADTQLNAVGDARAASATEIGERSHPTTIAASAPQDTASQERTLRPRAQVRRQKRQPPDEGDMVYDDLVLEVKWAYNALPAEAKAWVDSLVSEGKAAGVPWHTGGLHSERRYHLGRAIVALAGCGYLPGTAGTDLTIDDVTRGLVEQAILLEGTDGHWPQLGYLIGTLDAEQATRFAALVDEYLSPTPAA